VHSGAQSMPFDYNNLKPPFYSEAYREFAPVQDWTVNGITDLTLFLRGYPPRFIDEGGVITMSAQGADIYGDTDEFRFAYKQLNGNGSITLKVDDVNTVHNWTKAGVMIRSTLEPLAAQVHIVTGAQQSVVEWMYRAFNFDTTVINFNTASGSAPLPVWLRLTRAGDVFTGEYSTDGKTWSEITQADGTTSSATVTMPSSVYVGIVVSSHVSGVSAAARFSEIQTSGGVSGSWRTVDVGVDHAGNDAAPLYVAVEDNTGQKATITNPDPGAVNVTDWTEWKIPLSSFTGVNPAKVKRLYIGVGDQSTVGHGKLYIDDIRVTKP
jgi:regulation of enolase protein 1 (concanavalin A-like superfamily)